MTISRVTDARGIRSSMSSRWSARSASEASCRTATRPHLVSGKCRCRVVGPCEPGMGRIPLRESIVGVEAYRSRLPKSLSSRIPLAGVEKEKPQFTLSSTWPMFRLTIRRFRLSARSVDRYLERSNFNHPGAVLLIEIRLRKTWRSILKTLTDDSRSKVAAMRPSRRHWIVPHRLTDDPSEIAFNA